MKDLDLAIDTLNKEKAALCIVKDGKILYLSQEKGIYPLYMAVIILGNKLAGAALADKIIGKAAAMLCREAKIKTVYTKIVSEKALEYFLDLELMYQKKVPYILNRDRNDLCPVEKISDKVTNIDQLMQEIEKFLKENGRI